MDVRAALRGFLCSLAALGLLSACGSGGSDPFAGLDQNQRARARQILEVMRTDSCDAHRPSACTYTDFNYASQPAPAPGDQVIMLLDEQMGVATLGVHWQRVVAHFQAAAAPNYFVPYTPTTRFPRSAEYILHDVLRTSEDLASARQMFGTGQQFTRKYEPLTEPKGHGTIIFNIMAELNPQAKFVVVHLDPAFHRVPVCELNRPGGPAALRRYWTERAQAIARIARTYHVKFVNYSMGYDAGTFLQEWQRSGCAGPQPNLAQVQDFVADSNAIARELAAVPGLLFVQATAYPPEPLDNPAARANFNADCEAIPTRLRVGYFTYGPTELPTSSNRDLNLITGVMRRAAPCTDLYLRDGGEPGLAPVTGPIYFTGMGFGHGRLNIAEFGIGSSYVAPIGLSHAAFLMSQLGLAPAGLVGWVRGPADQPLLAAPFKRREFFNQSPHYLNWH